MTSAYTAPVRDHPDDWARWLAFVAAHPAATAYHNPEWRDVFAAAFGYRPAFLYSADASGSWTGCLPLFRVPSLWGASTLVAVPFRDRGGALFDSPATLTSLLTAARAMADDTRAAGVVIKALAPYPDDAVEAAGYTRDDRWIHSEINLAPFDAATLSEAINGKTRNMIRQAERAELTFREATNGMTDGRRWYELHRRSQQHLGLPPFPRSFFANLLRLETAKLFLIETGDGRPVAGTIVLLERKRAIYAYSASVAGVRDMRPNDFMLHRLILWLIERKVPVLDLGSDAPEQAGLLFFKRKWLAVQRPVSRYRSGAVDPGATDSSDVRYTVARAIVRHTPVAVAEAVLAPLVRYLG